MLISTELIKIELTHLRQRQQQLINDGNAITGAIQFCEHILKTYQDPLPENTSTTEPVLEDTNANS